ncbi:MAG: hypothetical protein ACLTYN_03780 [Dysosmobacter welbionis]
MTDVLARAVGVSCLYFLSLTTLCRRCSQILRRLRMRRASGPGDLICRYIFILQTACREMRDAAASRLGYDGLARACGPPAWCTAVLAKSFRRAGLL